MGAIPVIRSIRDIATHQRRDEAPRVGLRAVATEMRLRPLPPLFLLGGAPAAVHAALFTPADLPAPGCYAIEDAAVAPTGIAIKDATAFCSPQFIHPPHHVTAIIDRLNAESPPPRHVPGPLAVLYGPAHETYGHWLVDYLPRLWVLAQAGHDLASLRYLVPRELSPLVRDMLARIGITPAQLVPFHHWAETIRTDLLLMPTGLRTGDWLHPGFAEATRFWVRRLGLRTDAVESRLYLSRAGAPAERMVTNRARIEAMAKAAGYTVVQPERLGFADQVTLLAGARAIVGEYGSALHGAVYAGPGVVTCALRGTSRHPSFVQSGIATALRQSLGYVFGATDGQDVAQVFAIEEAAFQTALGLM